MFAAHSKSPRVLLQEDHDRIDALLSSLIASVRADDRDAIASAWSLVEEALLRHFDAEEMFIFPVLARAHGGEIRELRREHDEMRHALGEIDLAIELHTVRCEPIEDLCARLREHAKREDALAYVEAEQELHPAAVRSLLKRLRRLATALPRENLSRPGARP